MAAEIKIQPQDLWAKFQREKEELKTTMKLIAENPEYGVEIYLTEQDGYPAITVLVDDTECCCDVGLNASDCEQTASAIYDDYLTSKIIEILGAPEDDGDDLTEQEIQELIEDRENELSMLVYDFVRAVLDTDVEDYIRDPDTFCEDCVDHFLEYFDLLGVAGQFIGRLQHHGLSGLFADHSLHVHIGMIIQRRCV